MYFLIGIPHALDIDAGVATAKANMENTSSCIHKIRRFYGALGESSGEGVDQIVPPVHTLPFILRRYTSVRKSLTGYHH